MFGTSADDRAVEFTGIAIWEVRDGKLAHNWVERSAYELAQHQRRRNYANETQFRPRHRREPRLQN